MLSNTVVTNAVFLENTVFPMKTFDVREHIKLCACQMIVQTQKVGLYFKKNT